MDFKPLMMDEREFSKLIKKYQRCELSENERKLLDDWFEKLGQDKVHALWTTDDKFALKQRILQRIKGGDEQDDSATRKGVVALWRVAAAILLLAVSSYIIWNVVDEPRSAAVISQLSAVSGKVILPDGSIVWLKDNSELIYPAQFAGAKREVTLKGEALFEVAKDPDHPFTITCGELTTTVLGTSFHIKSIDNDIEVVVLTGKVSVKPSNGSVDAALVLLPNEKAVYHGSNRQLAKLESVKEERAALLRRTEYEMRFEDARMSEIIQRIERKFEIHVTVKDPTVNNCMITADLTDQSLNRTLTMISQALGLQYQISATGEVILSGTGCPSRKETN